MDQVRGFLVQFTAFFSINISCLRISFTFKQIGDWNFFNGTDIRLNQIRNKIELGPCESESKEKNTENQWQYQALLLIVWLWWTEMSF